LLSQRNRVSEIEKMILDYIVKHDYKIRISECAAELVLSFAEVENTIKSLSSKGLLNVFQNPKADRADFSCQYLSAGKCKAVQDDISLIERHCRNAIVDTCCYLCPHRQQCDIACDVFDQDNVDVQE